jgi:hypothetical protein
VNGFARRILSDDCCAESAAGGLATASNIATAKPSTGHFPIRNATNPPRLERINDNMEKVQRLKKVRTLA